MTIQELENQLLSLNPAEKLRIIQLLTQNLNAISTTTQPPGDRQYPLRGMPITIALDFDEPMPDLWDALGQ